MPGTTSLYITLARSSAKRICWPEIKVLARKYSIECEFNESELAVKFPSGSMIYLTGANQEVEIEKLRGLSNVALAYIDESQAFRSHIRELVEDILAKRLYDTNGRMRLIGTPGPIPAGYFYDSCHSPQWSHHAWTMLQNPWLLKKSGLTPEQLIEQDCARRGVTKEDPSIQRECFGKWALDDNALLLHYNDQLNHFEDLPKGVYSHIIGCDLGWEDSNSLTVLAYSDTSPVTYLVEEIVTANQLPDHLARDIQDLQKKYDVSRIVCDAGGLGKTIVEDLKARFGLPLEAAEKSGKMSNYMLLDNALRTGTFKAKRGSRFAQDTLLLEKDMDKSTPEGIKVRGHSDAVDSTLYAFKLSPAYGNTIPIPKPVQGTPEYDQAHAEAIFHHNLERLKRERENRDNQAGIGSWNTDDRGVPDWNKWE
jgi:hypothetical protein